MTTCKVFEVVQPDESGQRWFQKITKEFGTFYNALQSADFIFDCPEARALMSCTTDILVDTGLVAYSEHKLLLQVTVARRTNGFLSAREAAAVQIALNKELNPFVFTTDEDIDVSIVKAVRDLNLLGGDWSAFSLSLGILRFARMEDEVTVNMQYSLCRVHSYPIDFL